MRFNTVKILFELLNYAKYYNLVKKKNLQAGVGCASVEWLSLYLERATGTPAGTYLGRAGGKDENYPFFAMFIGLRRCAKNDGFTYM